MKPVIVLSMTLVVLSSQFGWGCQPVAQEASAGLVDFVLDVVTAPCNLLAICLGLDQTTCSHPQKSRLRRVPAAIPRRPRESLPVEKCPRASAPPAIIVPAPPGPYEERPGQPPLFQAPAQPLRTRQQPPPRRELIPVPPPGTPGISRPALPPAAPARPTPMEEQRTIIPRKKTVPGTPEQPVPLPPQRIAPGISKETPPGVPPRLEPTAVPRAEKPRKVPKQGKERYVAPCMPVHPPCGPGLFFR